MTYRGAFFLAVVLMSSPTASRAAAQASSVETDVNRAVDELFASFTKGDSTGFLSHYSSLVTVYRDGANVADPQTHLRNFARNVTQIRVYALEWNRREVQVLGSDVALFAGEFKETLSTPGSSDRRDYQVAWTALLRKIEGSWRIVHEHTSHARQPR
jgi:ketosteroid isomerase-like protein